MKWGWILKGLKVVGIITGKLPAMLEDGKITVDEMVDLTQSILSIFDVPVSFDIPDELKGQIMAITMDE